MEQTAEDLVPALLQTVSGPLTAHTPGAPMTEETCALIREWVPSFTCPPVGTLPPGATPAPASDPEPDDNDTSFTGQVFTLTNVERTRRGLATLSRDECLEGYAQRHAENMASGRVGFQHQSLSPIMSGCRLRSVAENIAYGYRTPEAFMTGWMNSSGHRANILSASSTLVGIGIATSSSGRIYGVQVFGRR